MVRITKTLLVVTAILFSGLAAASNWPDNNRTMKFMIPWPAGGLNDLIARSINDEVGKSMGITIVPEYRPGAGGTVGVGALSRAKPDGYTIGMGNLGPLTIYPNLYQDRLYEVSTDLIPIMSFAASPLVLVVPATSSIESAAELAEKMREEPGEFNFASVGVGSPQHLTFELFQQRNEIEGVHIPYNGTAEYMVDLTSGALHATFDTLALLMPHIKAGDLKPLAVTTSERIGLIPEVPTLMEEGLMQSDDQITSWYGLIVPAGTPEEIAARLFEEYNRVAQSDQIQQLLAENGLMYETVDRQVYKENIEKETRRWKTIIEQAQIEVE